MFLIEQEFRAISLRNFVLPLIFALSLFFISPAILAQQQGPGEAPTPAAQQTEIWLVTYGPGQIYWQRFGHNGIWIRDPDLGLDHVFNFGFFDFDQEGFMFRFLQGRLEYFSAAQPAQEEFSQYINEDRSIRVQRLALSQSQALDLVDYLVAEVQPDKREYLYDYYWNNCSTRVRDALDLALGGQLRNQFVKLVAKQDMRDQTRRLTGADFWLYLGLELGLGSPVDQPISRWDEFFIPAELADGMTAYTGEQTTLAGPLLVEDLMLYESSHQGPPEYPETLWSRYLLFSVAMLLLSFLFCQVFGWLKPTSLARSWLVIAGLLGITLACLWLFTDHSVTRNNLSLLIFNPVWLLCMGGKRTSEGVGWLVIVLGGISLAMPWLPPGQYTLDEMAAFLPLNLAAAFTLLRANRLAANLRPQFGQ